MPLRRRLRSVFALAAGGLASLAILAGVGPAPAAADSSCPDNRGCIWSKTFFTGTRIALDGSEWGGTGWWPITQNYNSAKNRYEARKLKVGRFVYPNSIDLIACLDPHEVRPDPGWFDHFLDSGITGDECG
jgi:hypothetical protein